MGQFFPPERGDMEITDFYADNQPYCREVRFSVPYDEWSEFEGSTFFQELSRYLEDLKKRTRDSNKARHEPERTEETEIKDKRRPWNAIKTSVRIILTAQFRFDITKKDPQLLPLKTSWQFCKEMDA